ncbi:Flp pilus assembly protein CpaB [Thiohalorhabdus denitrificans]|uniref:Pilus assembly protein CpaB n=1 Tax=Thiohalorhabdus denitrificans TaxID=381306 RepID=A0A1G5DM51_9GAMM|nr:Flp pilus assembly protein CpaB [Thiohalorhabdus denitrificans]SCY15734.1 pilus assembly protein CpaB [Thiohalorhabdus denitrificans]
MERRALITLSVAVVIGGIAVWLLNTQLQPPEPEVVETSAVETRPVVVVTEDLAAGDDLRDLLVTTVDWPKEAVPEGAYADPDRLLGGDAPPTLTKEIRKGEPVLDYKVAGKGRLRGLTAKIPEGMRAITIPVNEVRGVGGFVLPGDRVDVLHTTTAGRIREDKVTRILEQNLRVLGIDQVASEEEEEPKVVNTVTLRTTPEQAQRITLAESVGELSLALRNEGDGQTPRPNVIATGNLITPPANPRPVASSSSKEKTKKASSDRKVELIRGLVVEEKRVPEGQEASPDGPEQQAKADQ